MHLRWDLISRHKRYVKPLPEPTPLVLININLKLHKGSFSTRNYFILSPCCPAPQQKTPQLPLYLRYQDTGSVSKINLQIIFLARVAYQVEMILPRTAWWTLPFTSHLESIWIYLSMRNKLLLRTNTPGLEKCNCCNGQVGTTDVAQGEFQPPSLPDCLKELQLLLHLQDQCC